MSARNPWAFDPDYGPPTTNPLDPRNDDLDDDEPRPTEAELDADARAAWEDRHERD